MADRTITSERGEPRPSTTTDGLLALLTYAMEAIPSAAFITNKDGVVLFSNAEGRRLLCDVTRTGDEIRRAVGGDPTARFSVSRVEGRPGRERRLVVACSSPPLGSPASSVEVAAKTWRLSRRQAEVLALVVEGYPNASIAQHLGISICTVEVHVTALLARADVDNRSSLVVRALGEAATSRA